MQYGSCQHGSIMTTRDKPWLFRTYAGHSTAAQSNPLFRTNLSKGQTGLSVAFAPVSGLQMTAGLSLAFK